MHDRTEDDRRDDHLDRLNEGVPQGLHLLAKLWIEMTEQHAEHDRGQYLGIEALKERPVVGGQFGCCGLGCHRRLSLSFLRIFPVPAQGFHAIISLANANGGIAVLHPIHGPCRLVGPCQVSKCGDWPRMTSSTSSAATSSAIESSLNRDGTKVVRGGVGERAVERTAR